MGVLAQSMKEHLRRDADGPVAQGRYRRVGRGDMEQLPEIADEDMVEIERPEKLLHSVGCRQVPVVPGGENGQLVDERGRHVHRQPVRHHRRYGAHGHDVEQGAQRRARLGEVLQHRVEMQETRQVGEVRGRIGCVGAEPDLADIEVENLAAQGARGRRLEAGHGKVHQGMHEGQGEARRAADIDEADRRAVRQADQRPARDEIGRIAPFEIEFMSDPPLALR